MIQPADLEIKSEFPTVSHRVEYISSISEGIPQRIIVATLRLGEVDRKDQYVLVTAPGEHEDDEGDDKSFPKFFKVVWRATTPGLISRIQGLAAWSATKQEWVIVPPMTIETI